MTDRPALARAIFEALNLFDSLGPVKADEDIATIVRVLAEHETAYELSAKSYLEQAANANVLFREERQLRQAAEARCAQVEEECASRREAWNSAIEVQARYDMLHAEHERLRAALARYGQHGFRCATTLFGSAHGCSCGFMAALAPSQEPK